MSCGIIVYGVDYIRSKVTNIKQWVQMNPGIQFIIVTTLLTDTEAERVAIEEIITELNTELVGLIPVTIVYIDEPIVKWYKIELQRLKLPIHFLSDIIRWFGLYAINQQKGGHVFLLEADTVCKRNGWMKEVIDHFGVVSEEQITVYGPDRACIFYSGISEHKLLDHILSMYRNVYKYRIEQNIFVGNFEHYMADTDIEYGLKQNTHYQTLIGKSLESRSTEEDMREFIKDLPTSILGIGIFRFNEFKIIRPYRMGKMYDAEEKHDYEHDEKKEWMNDSPSKRRRIEGGTKRKKNKTKRKKNKTKRIRKKNSNLSVLKKKLQ